MSLPYRDNVAAILIRDDLILLGERINHPGLWQLPQGGLESGEDRETALMREIEEELGIRTPLKLCTIEREGPTLRYDWPEQASTQLRRRYCGQEQTLYLVRFDGTDQEIDPLDSHEPEFRAFEWLEPEAAVARCWDVKRPNLIAALEMFGLF